MKVAQLFSHYKYFRLGKNENVDISAISVDSRKIDEHTIFVAVRGSKIDGHDFIETVCAQNVAGIVVEDAQKVPAQYNGAVLIEQNTREALVNLAARFYGYPANELTCIGVTGTNGKTSVTYMIEAILNYAGQKTGVMGTIDHHFEKHIWPSELTTPDPITLQKRLREFITLGAKAVAFEVSSHALDQGRVVGIPFQVAIFTNLTRDHLDYHKTMDDYFAAKNKLFSVHLAQNKTSVPYAIINANDDWGKKINVFDSAKMWTYGEVKSDFHFQVLATKYSGTRFRLRTKFGESEIEIKMTGRHNVYNAVAAIAAGMALGVSQETCVDAIQKFNGVPGRLNRVDTNNTRHVFVDYAHTDDALKTVLHILKEIRSHSHVRNKIITVFGCGGDRDKGKRPLMARAAIEGSDIVYVTSDNPRTEDPMLIIEDIISETDNKLINSKVFVEVDRREAIAKAIMSSDVDDVILIAGKGHEDYQIIGTHKNHFSDFEVAREVLNGM